MGGAGGRVRAGEDVPRELGRGAVGGGVDHHEVGAFRAAAALRPSSEAMGEHAPSAVSSAAGAAGTAAAEMQGSGPLVGWVTLISLLILKG